ncbi:MAG: exodeoxyribonuclease III [Lachnospiraceae bacterium]|nr:exodeoxyribonuclease III [Lachnospiraceae bacterium]
MRKLASWNVNGLRACVSKGEFDAFLRKEQPDLLGIQETKLQKGQIDLSPEGYGSTWNYAERKGYAGTAVFFRKDFAPEEITTGIGIPEHDKEGRVLTLRYPSFFFVTVYTPNSQDELKRLSYRMEWESAFLSYLNGLKKQKEVIVCGDLNVAHREIDLKNPQTNHHNPGFTDEERAAFSTLLKAGYTDTFRHFYPEQEGAYSWWSYRGGARIRNAGWRIDYFVVSDALLPKVKDAFIYQEQKGSDHCPVGLLLDV